MLNIKNLIKAISKGDVKKTEQEIQKGQSVDFLIGEGATPLMLSVKLNQVKIAQLLIEKKADVNRIDFDGKTCLMHASENGSAYLVSLLLKANADIDKKNHFGQTALMYGAIYGQDCIVDFLVNCGADPNIEDEQGMTACDYANSRYSYESIKILEQVKKKKNRSIKAKIKENPPKSKSILKKIIERDVFDEYKDINNFSSYKTQLSWIFIFALLLKYIPVIGLYILTILLFFLLKVLIYSIPSPLILGQYYYKKFFIKSDTNSKKQPDKLKSLNLHSADKDLYFIDKVLKFSAQHLRDVQNNILISNKFTPEILRLHGFSSQIVIGILAQFIILTQIPFEISFSWNFILFVLGVVVIFIIGLYYFFRGEKQNRRSRLNTWQQQIDDAAREIARFQESDKIRLSDLSQSFGIYLRSFKTTEKLLINGMDIEVCLAYLITPHLHIIAFGMPGRSFGPGKITASDQQWKNRIITFFKNTNLVLIIPWHTRGIVWEIKYLLENNYIYKTIFIMPPEIGYNNKPFSKEWQKTVRTLKREGFSLPDHFKKGLIFSLDNSGQINKHAPFSLNLFVSPKLEYPDIEWEDRKEESSFYEADGPAYVDLHDQDKYGPENDVEPDDWPEGWDNGGDDPDPGDFDADG